MGKANPIREFLGKTRKCSICGKVGRERLLATGQEEADAQPETKHVACSVPCAEAIMQLPDWGSLGWLK